MSEYRHGRVSRPRRPWYARALGIRHLYLSNVMCVLLFEGSVALAVLMALTELVSWWVVLILPLTVAAMVKLNDLVAGAQNRHG
ncbi:hypothetical protein GCM10009853_068510 [Glycomyces scopariae]|uniref:Uncharacterized protein n=1 Tax=Glycomyces sambucus TaxID=380244 RepID=A0A1G9L0E1_9ACTN|nr:hypothetical protein [Glycomyces sambucus]SDL55233.1 hypothetical protein SAMN05216298_4335 [Glycomyces sambucus]